MLPRPEAPNPEHILGVHVIPLEGVNDMWADAQMTEVIEYLGGSFLMSLPEAWRSCLPFHRQWSGDTSLTGGLYEFPNLPISVF